MNNCMSIKSFFTSSACFLARTPNTGSTYGEQRGLKENNNNQTYQDPCSSIKTPTNFKKISNSKIDVYAGSLEIPECINGYKACATFGLEDRPEVFGCSNEYEVFLEKGVRNIDDWGIGTNILGIHFTTNFTGEIIKNGEIIAIFENEMFTLTETGLKAFGLELNSDTGYLTVEGYCAPLPGSEMYNKDSMTFELPAYIQISPDGEKTPFRLFGNNIKIHSIDNQTVHVEIIKRDTTIPIDVIFFGLI